MRARAAGWAVAALLVGCESEIPFDPEGVELQGVWLVSDVTQPIGGTTPQGGTNQCRLTDVPMTVTASTTPNTWTASQEEGGTIQCELDGVWGPAVTPTERLFFVVTRTGGEVRWIVSGRFCYYVGSLTNENRMGGAVDPEGYGREGTWSARRS
jgi:hypothetical protein